MTLVPQRQGQTDRETDEQTTYDSNTAIHIIVHRAAKKRWKMFSRRQPLVAKTFLSNVFILHRTIISLKHINVYIMLSVRLYIVWFLLKLFCKMCARFLAAKTF